MANVIHSFEVGVGNTLGHIAIVVALGTMLGKMMAESGGADTIALTLIRVFGEKRVPWAMMCIGLIVGLPAFFEVGFVLLIPIAFTVARRTGAPLISVALPLSPRSRSITALFRRIPPRCSRSTSITPMSAAPSSTR